MKKSLLILVIATTLGACGGGNGTSDIPGQAPQSEYETWLSQGNKGSYEDYLYQQSFTKPEHSINENNLENMSFTARGSREFALPPQPIKIQTNDNGDITSIELTDYNDPNTFMYPSHYPHKDATYNFTEQNGKYQSQTIYYYSLPIKYTPWIFGGVSGIDFSTDKELSLAEIKEKFLEIMENYSPTNNENERKEIIASINALTESDARIKPVCYDMNCGYTEADLGHYFISPQSLTMDVDAFGRDVGLKYSNFGTMRGTYNQDSGTLPRAYVFAGGQPEKAINKNDISGKMTFSGKAVGEVLYHYSDFKDTQQSYLDVAADAHLNFDNGAEELVMNFSDNPDANKRWYDVKISSDANGEITTTISNGDKITDQNNKYKFSGIEDGIFPTIFPTTTSFDKTNYATNTRINTEYFGSDKTPSEVVGTATIYELQWSNDVDDGYNHELTLFTTFGATKDK